MKTQKKCISFGNCNKKYFLIILVIFLLVLVELILFYVFEKYNDDKEEFQNILSYLFFKSLGQFLMIIPGLIIHKSISPKKKETNENQSTKLSIEYIFNKDSIGFSLKEKIYFFSAGLLKLIMDIINIFNQALIQNSDTPYISTYTFQFDLLFLFLLSKITYRFQFYKHQYLSIIIISLLGLMKYIMINYKKKIGVFFVALFICAICSFLNSLLTVYIKGLMEYKYFTPYKACYIYGLINLIISTIAYIIASFIPCESNICKASFNGKYYFAQILNIFSIPGLFLFIIYLLQGFMLALNYNVIYEFSVFHSFLVIQLYQILTMKSDEEGDYILIIIQFLIGIFFILVFLEIIEINICNISYNTKLNISKRAINDEELLTVTDEGNCEEEEMEEEN